MSGNTAISRMRRFVSTAWGTAREIFSGRARRNQPIVDRDGFAYFLRTRASHVTQTSLYGYLRARAGTRYPELFNDNEFLKSVNIAKWQIWLACVSDLAVFSGGMVCRRAKAPAAEVGALVRGAVDSLLNDTGEPDDAGDEFGSHRARVRARLALCEWSAVPDDETAFSESPSALVHWAPVVEDYKQLDEAIVRNSMRFRWQEVRQELRNLLDAEAVLASGRGDTAAHKPPSGSV